MMKKQNADNTDLMDETDRHGFSIRKMFISLIITSFICVYPPNPLIRVPI